MSRHRETNPYFASPTVQDQYSQLPSSVAEPTPRRQTQDQQNRPPVPWSPPPQTQDQHSQPPLPQGQDPHTQPPPSSQVPRTKRAKRHNQRDQRPLGPWATLPDTHAPTQPQQEGAGREVTQPKQQRRGPQEAQGTQPKHEGQHPRPQDQHPRPPPSLQVPSPRRTKLLTWFLAGFCAIFWVVVILGGLIVLIVYLVFRPHNPRFDVSSVTLNAAYLDVGVLLNADLTLLANFTNPNSKVKIDFSYVVLNLYYGSTLIASQYVEPFSAARATSWLTNIHMVTSQVRLPSDEVERLHRELNNNTVMFQVKGVFRARSNLGSFLRYSYWLYSHCNIILNGPPSGVVRASKCKTKR